MSYCSPHKSRNNSSSIPYHQIWDEDDLIHHERQRTRRRLLVIAAIVAATIVVLLPPLSSLLPFPFGQPQPHAGPKQHLLPTILYVVDPLTGSYLNAIDNPLYDKVKSATFVNSLPELESDHHADLPQLAVDRTSYLLRQPLTLSWSHGGSNTTTFVQDDDMILLLCGDDDDQDSFSHDQFLEAATVAHARATSHKHSGNGDQEWYIPSFPITQHRACQFALYQQQQQEHATDASNIIATTTTTTFQLLTKSPKFTLHGPETATAIHLAFTSNPNEMMVHFTTFVEGIPTVWYWPAGPAPVRSTAQGVSHTYTAEDMCQAPANITEAGKFQPPGFLHQVTLTNLQPYTMYYYHVGVMPPSSSPPAVEQQQLPPPLSPPPAGPFSFTSSPPRGDDTPFTFLVYGDQGVVSDVFGDQGQWTAAMVARELDSHNYNNQKERLLVAIHHFGDLSYAMGAAHVWEDWFYQISSFSPHVPLMISVGNHEYDHTEGGGNGKDPSNVTDPHGYMPRWGNFGDDSGGECGVPTAARFRMPQSPGSNGVFWYSFDMASVHTIVLSSEHDLFPGSPQHAWLLADLQLVDRHVTPWLIVELHRPLYEAEPSMPNDMVGIALRHAIEDLLIQYKVDVVLAGHYHAYHRTCDGLYRGKCHAGGPMHITVGSAGASLDPKLPLFPVPWTETFIAQEYGYGRVTVHNATVLRFDYVKAGPESDPTAGDIHDTAWIVRPRG